MYRGNLWRCGVGIIRGYAPKHQGDMAEIKARDRTVLSYLTKPITRTLAQGMGER